MLSWRQCQRAERTDQDVLKRCRLIPSFLIFESSVCLGYAQFGSSTGGPPDDALRLS